MRSPARHPWFVPLRIAPRLVVAVLVAGALTFAGCGGDSDSEEQAKGEPYKIAWVGPQTGVFAVASSASINSAKAIVADVNKEGGVNGSKVEFITADDLGQPNQTLQKVRDLRDQGVKVFLIQFTAGLLALQPLMDGSILTMIGNPPAILNDPEQLPFNFNYFPSNEYAVRANAEFAKEQGLSKVAVVSDTTAQFQEYVKLAKEIMPESDQEIVLEQRFDPGTTDFSPVISKIKSSGADSVLFVAAGPPVPRFYTAAAAANLQLPILGGYGNGASDLSSVPASFLKRYAYHVTTSPWLLDEKTDRPILDGYADLMTDVFFPRFGRKAYVGGGQSWDGVQALMWAIEKAESDDPAELRAALESTAEDGKSFADPSVKYRWSKENHGGFPSSQVAVAHLYGDPEWPNFFYEAD